MPFLHFFVILNYFSRDNKDKNGTTMVVLDRHHRMPANTSHEILRICYHCLFRYLHCPRVQRALRKICNKLHHCMVLFWITIMQILKINHLRLPSKIDKNRCAVSNDVTYQNPRLAKKTGCCSTCIVRPLNSRDFLLVHSNLSIRAPHGSSGFKQRTALSALFFILGKIFVKSYTIIT